MLSALIFTYFNYSIAEDSTIHVYNCSSYTIEIITMEELVELGFSITKDIPLEGIIWKPHSTLTKNKFFYYFVMLLLHVLPALFIDGILKLCGIRPM